MQHPATSPKLVIEPRIIGRYALFDEIAHGGMATVHVGRLLGPVGFARTVAIKRLHPQFAKDPEFVSMFLDEARLAARIRHPNVVPTLDVVALEHELFLVMDYIQGDSLSRVLRTLRANKVEPPSPFLTTIMAQVLHGLHAAHEARTERGEPLCIVHRDVSPQNILIGSDGVPRVLDFGVAKAAHRVQSTRDGQLKGKLSYMSPEQILGEEVDRRTDIYAAAVVLWEAIAGRRLYEAENDGKLVASIVAGATTPPSKYSSSSNPAIDAVVMKGLAKEKNDRFATAREFAIALEKVAPLASSSEIGVWVDSVLGEEIAKRTNRVEEIESFSDVTNLRIPSKPPTMRVASRGPANTDDQGTAITGNENGPLSAVTSLSSAKSLAGIPAGPKKWWIPAVALFVLGSGSLFFALRSGSKPETSLVPSKPAPEPTVGTIPKPDLSATPAPETNPAASASVAANSATPPLETKPNTGVVQKTTVQKTTKRVETTKVVTSAQPVATAASPNCTPPWFLDEDGIKHVKPGCSR